MPNLVTVQDLAAGDVIQESWVDDVMNDVNFLVVAGADIASGTTVTVTNAFHKVTGTTTIDNLSHAAPVKGQEARLWFASGLTVRNNGGGTGNIRTVSGGDRAVLANEVVAFVYDGAVWRETAGTPLAGVELAYVEATADVACGTSNTQLLTTTVTTPACTALIEFYAAGYTTNQTASFGTLFIQLDGPGIGIVSLPLTNSTFQFASVSWRRRVALAAGSHTFAAFAVANNGTVTMKAGVGTGNATNPMSLRVTRV